MKKIAKIISSSLILGMSLAVFMSCERIDLEGIGELNKIELWYGPYTNDAAPLPSDSALIDLVEKDLGISLTAVPLPSNKDEQTEMIMEAAKNNTLPDLFMVNRDVLSVLVKENKVARVDPLYPMMPERTHKMYDEAAKQAKAEGYEFYFEGLARQTRT